MAANAVPTRRATFAARAGRHRGGCVGPTRASNQRDTEASVDAGRRETLLLGGSALLMAGSHGSALAQGEQSVYDFTAKMYGEYKPLNEFSDCVTVIVNVASE